MSVEAMRGCKKWYVITGILALLLVMSIGTCSENSAQVDRSDRYIGTLKAKLGKSEAGLAPLKEQLVNAESELAQLKEVKKAVGINFGSGLRVFDIREGGRWEWDVLGKVQNISDKPMKLVKIMVAFYDADGQIVDIGTSSAEDLYPNETAKWGASSFGLGGWNPGEGGSFDVYALGNK